MPPTPDVGGGVKVVAVVGLLVLAADVVDPTSPWANLAPVDHASLGDHLQQILGCKQEVLAKFVFDVLGSRIDPPLVYPLTS